MEALLRNRAGSFCVKDSLRLAEVEDCVNRSNLSQLLLPLDSVFSDLRYLILKDDAVSLGYNGNPFYWKHVIRLPIGTDTIGSSSDAGTEPGNGERFRVYDGARRFIGVYRYEAEQGRFRPERKGRLRQKPGWRLTCWIFPGNPGLRLIGAGLHLLRQSSAWETQKHS